MRLTGGDWWFKRWLVLAAFPFLTKYLCLGVVHCLCGGLTQAVLSAFFQQGKKKRRKREKQQDSNTGIKSLSSYVSPLFFSLPPHFWIQGTESESNSFHVPLERDRSNHSTGGIFPFQTTWSFTLKVKIVTSPIMYWKRSDVPASHSF